MFEEAVRGVDVHAHAVPRRFLERVAATGLGAVDVARSGDGYVLTFPHAKPLRPAGGIMLDFEERLRWLDEQEMERQLVAPWLDVHGQELEPAVGREWVRSLNDLLAEEVAATGGRVEALATLHLADGDAAATELARAVKEKVASGEYATESEVIRDGLRALMARDRAVENWLRDEVGPAYDALKVDPSRAVTAKRIRARLATEHQKVSARK